MKLGIENVKIEKCSAHSLFKFARFICDEFEISEVLGEFFMPRHENYTGENTKHHKKLSKYVINKIRQEGLHFYSGTLGGAGHTPNGLTFEFVYIERYEAVFIIGNKDNTLVTCFKPTDNKSHMDMIKRELLLGPHDDPEMERKRMNRIRAYGMGIVSARSIKIRNSL